MRSERFDAAERVKAFHATLRRDASRFGGDEAWRRHVDDVDSRKRYADTMRHLAALWTRDDRLEWIASQLKDYFIDASHTKWRQRELTLAERLGLRPQPVTRQIDRPRLLDVGSCCNAFARYKFIDTLPIDLTPATDDVLQCDFVNVRLGDEELISNGRVEQLRSTSFDAIAFCLLLEYLPTSAIRSQCCQTAYKLLTPEGVLAIVTPDSKHVGANAKLYKNWRYALARIGFSRIVYEKLPNLHCMLFRKCTYIELPLRWAEIHEEPYMCDEINIPQDFNEQTNLCDDSNKQVIYDPSSVAALFDCLPEL